MSNQLRGGSQSQPHREFTHGFFHQGVKVIKFKTADITYGRILPAFDFEKEGDEFKTSHVPYRELNAEPNSEGHVAFSSWFFPILGLDFAGNQKKTLILPSTLQLAVNSDDRQTGICPIWDIRNYVRNNYDDNTKKSLLNKPEGDFRQQSIVPNAREFALMNMLIYTNPAAQLVENRVAIISGLSLKNLQKTLNLRAGRGDEVLSPAYPDYLFGDVTAPDTGLMATVSKHTSEDNSNINYAGFSFSTQPATLTGHNKWPLGDTTELWLGQRYNIADTDTVTKVWSYQEVVDFLVEDGRIPHAIIEVACGEFADIPAETATSRAATHALPGTTGAPPAVPAVGTAPAPAGTAPAPAAGAPNPAVAAAAPAAPAAPTGDVPVTDPTAPPAAPGVPPQAPAAPANTATAPAPAAPQAPTPGAAPQAPTPGAAPTGAPTPGAAPTGAPTPGAPAPSTTQTAAPTPGGAAAAPTPAGGAPTPAASQSLQGGSQSQTPASNPAGPKPDVEDPNDEIPMGDSTPPATEASTEGAAATTLSPEQEQKWTEYKAKFDQDPALLNTDQVSEYFALCGEKGVNP